MVTASSLDPLAPVLAHLGLDDEVRSAVVLVDSHGGADVLDRVVEALSAAPGDTWCLIRLPGAPTDAALARLRDTLWPRVHVSAVYRSGTDGTRVESLHEHARIGDPCGTACTVLASRALGYVLSPDATARKFDANAAGWNGDPEGHGYRHHRWMRRHVACFGPPAPAGARILDFGCGAGWVGIEAALATSDATLCAFDPSPEMVRHAGENARSCGVHEFTGRVGFGEAPPFPAEGEPPFDLVLTSGVVSFARDFEAWMDGLVRAVRPGGALVFGDLDPRSRGMSRRRLRRPCLPVRELNARTSAEVRAWLESRGFVHEAVAGYQLTTPVPQLMHLSDTRLGGLLSRPLVGLNAGLAGLDRRVGHRLVGMFDSYVMRFARRD